MRPFAPQDLDELNRWYAARGLPLVPLSALPAIGVVVDGVAAGFLYRTDSDIALLDGYVTNPAAGGRARRAAFDAIVEELVRAAKCAGARRVIGMAASGGVSRAVDQLGLRFIGLYSMHAREV